MKRNGHTVIEMLMALLILAAGFISMARGLLVSEDVAHRALEVQGYTNIKIVDHAWFAVGLRGCDTTDAVMFTANATNPIGKEVQLYVCGGWIFKGATIRTK